MGSISFGTAFVAGKKRVPRPAAGMIALRTRRAIVLIPVGDVVDGVERRVQQRDDLAQAAMSVAARLGQLDRALDDAHQILFQSQHVSPYFTAARFQISAAYWRMVRSL